MQHLGQGLSLSLNFVSLPPFPFFASCSPPHLPFSLPDPFGRVCGSSTLVEHSDSGPSLGAPYWSLRGQRVGLFPRRVPPQSRSRTRGALGLFGRPSPTWPRLRLSGLARASARPGTRSQLRGRLFVCLIQFARPGCSGFVYQASLARRRPAPEGSLPSQGLGTAGPFATVPAGLGRRSFL